MASFSTILKRWYQSNRRDLPWRGISDPYPVWLSEIILQQTRVDQGMSYYHRFLELFPTIYHLSVATEDEVLRAWQGLGYYSRARNLHATAQRITAEMNGLFPADYRGLIALKGVGPYTAAAIASFCYNEPVAVLDGNVMRVLSRIFGVYEGIDMPAGKKKLQELASANLDVNDPATHNQAMMEFGALHCTPVDPKCPTCPFRATCIALKNDDVDILPVKDKKTKVVSLWMDYFLVWNGNEVYMRRRSGKGIWQGLYDLPSVDSVSGSDPEIVISNFRTANQLTFSVISVSSEMIHILTHRKIHSRLFVVRATEEWKNLPTGVFSVPFGDIDKYGVPRLVQKLLAALQ